ncbi:MAG: TIGR03905 family TSCPD domain-containing protein [Ruminococcaceae bacterium]|nr:TIGR03905 family TSCPD domain-containing protein [Oscillospiraceae bacterium]
MQYSYQTSGTCSREILFDIEDGKLTNVQFIGGCNGNLKGICSLVEGMDVQDVISRLEGTTCGPKNTSCPDQLARALKQAQAK